MAQKYRCKNPHFSTLFPYYTFFGEVGAGRGGVPTFLKQKRIIRFFCGVPLQTPCSTRNCAWIIHAQFHDFWMNSSKIHHYYYNEFIHESIKNSRICKRIHPGLYIRTWFHQKKRNSTLLNPKIMNEFVHEFIKKHWIWM